MTDKPSDYMVVTDVTSNKLANQVVFWIKQGWTLCGGVAFAPHPKNEDMGHFFLFAQAMTKTED